ncbi:MAG: DUF3311 domain-containing protein [Dethiosulfovibrio sp.]|nr:DUF3311 domain-containing protein [Dethiosulfovibrio sp.]
MGLSRGERKVLWCFALIVAGYMPPVLNLANRVSPVILGVPFILFWSGLMVPITTCLMTYAYIVREKEDGENR